MLPEPVIHDGGWVCVSAQVGGERVDMLRRQSRIPAPAKLVPGLMLKAEMPAGADLAVSIAAVRDSLALATAILARAPGMALEIGPRMLDAEAVALRLRDSSVEFVAEGDAFLAQKEGIRLTAKITDAVIFQTDLVRFQQSEDAALRALAHFSLALNARLRFARASLLDDRLVLEVALPPAALTPDVIQKAVGSLQVGVEVARKECAALSDPRMAARYLEFHKEI